MTDSQQQNLDLMPDFALFRGHLNGLVAFFPLNERPLQGLAGLLDWRFQGVLSEQIKAGAISGKPGECVYVPVSRAQVTYHLLLAGAGYSNFPGDRSQIPAESLHALKRNLVSLKLERIGISRSDIGVSDELLNEFLNEHLKGAPLWIVQ